MTLEQTMKIVRIQVNEVIGGLRRSIIYTSLKLGVRGNHEKQ